MIDVGNTQTRGFANWGGNISFYYPSNWTDTSDANYQSFTAVEEPKTVGYIIIRVDGQKTTSSAPVQEKVAVANDFVSIYKVISEGYSVVATGESAYKATINFINQGSMWTNATVATSVTLVTPAAIGATAYTVGGKTPLGSARTGRVLAAVTNIINGTANWFDWVSDDTSVATVDTNGVVTGVAVGSADITAVDRVHGVSSSALTVTIA